MRALAVAYGHFQQLRGAMTRLAEALRVPPESGGKVGRMMGRGRGDIEFCSVSFAYPGGPAILQDFHLSIADGETVAFIGPNGAGKSTLIHLLMRFYIPQAGQIRISGIDIATVSLASLRRHIGLVPQHPLLCNGTIRDNLLYGKSHPTRAELERAAQAARAHDFIMQLPDGYETLVGDNGVKLSGGQQQRLALARALLKDPAILILDEATAMYDPAGECELLQAIQALLRQRTVLLITHHPRPLALADRIIRLDHGVICEETTLPLPAPSIAASPTRP
jgi:subfamily B ATP-binding cassette protein MsbA